MKNTFIQLILIALPVFLNAQISDKPIHATFGRYGLNCSSGRGACSFTSAAKSDVPTNEQSAAKSSDNAFRLTIPRSKISRDDETRIAGKTFDEFLDNEKASFVQEQVLHLDNAILQILNINTKYNAIIPGIYTLKITPDQVQIQFTLSESK